MGKTMSRHFTKENIQKANEHILNGCSTLLAIREIQVKATVRYHIC